MVHGSGSHHSHHGRSEGRDTQQTGRTQRRGVESQRSPEARNNTERHNHGGGGGHHHHHRSRSNSGNNNGGRSANRNIRNTNHTATSTRQARVPAPSVTTTRPNHGSGTHQHARGRSANSNTRNTTTTSPVPAAAAVGTTRHNHGSGTHNNRANRSSMPVSQTNEASHRQERSTTTTTTRQNHGSGTHHYSSNIPAPSTTHNSWWNRRNHRQDVPVPRRVFAPANNRPRQTTNHHHHHQYSRAFNNEQERDYYEQDRGSGSDGNGCCKLLCRFCGCFWSFVGAILLGFYAVTGAILCCKPCFSSQRSDANTTTEAAARAVGTTATTATTNRHHPHRRQGCSWWLFPTVGLLLSVVTLFALIQNSTMDTTNTTGNLSPTDDISDNNIWTLFVGETQRIFLPRLVRDVRVTVVSATDPSVQAAVFKFAKNCPPLTGPPVILQHDSAFDLPGGNFEYDYYNLYPGSTVDVRFNQLNGATYFYLLKGAEALRDIQTGRNIDPNHWETIAVAKRYVTPDTSPTNSDVHYKVRGQNNDIFTLVYDNASTQRDSSVDVETDLALTTYNLAGYTPQCDNMHWWGKDGDSCHIAATRDNCVVLEAFATGPGDNNNNDRVISLRIDAYRNWKRIGLWSALPLALASFICIWQFLVVRCCRRPTAVTEEEEEADATEPLLPNDVGDEQIMMERPPPTVPHHLAATRPQPSAPPGEDPPVIVVPPESVETLPVGRK